MKFNFILNKYLLMWHILYLPSIDKDIDKIKRELINSSEKEYLKTKEEKRNILVEKDNYIPFDDYVFYKLSKSDAYKKIRKETNKYRLTLLEIWGKNRKKYLKEIHNLLKCNIDVNFNIYVIHPKFNLVQLENSKTNNSLIFGKNTKLKEQDSFLTFLFYQVLIFYIGNFKRKDHDLVEIILELTLLNELYTRVTKVSHYNIGKKEYRKLKEQIYPYFLMYLGVKKDDMKTYMKRDKISFSLDDLEYNYNLKMMDIFSFINYISKNKDKLLNKKSKKEVETL